MPSFLLHIIIQQDDMLSDRSSSPENRSLPPSSPLKRHSGQNMGQVPTDPYARVDVAKKAYERQKKAELEKRWRLNSGMSMNKSKVHNTHTYVYLFWAFDKIDISCCSGWTTKGRAECVCKKDNSAYICFVRSPQGYSR